MASAADSQADLVRESELTRLVRTLLRRIKGHVLENTSISVSVDYDDTVGDGLDIVALSKLPALVLMGPRLSENRFYSTNQLTEVQQEGTNLVDRLTAPYTADLIFTITAASNRTVELLNLMAAFVSFLNRNRWLELPRELDNPTSGVVRWELDRDGDFRTKLDGPDDVRAFTGSLVIRGFDVDEGMVFETSRLVEETELETDLIIPAFME